MVARLHAPAHPHGAHTPVLPQGVVARLHAPAHPHGAHLVAGAGLPPPAHPGYCARLLRAQLPPRERSALLLRPQTP